MTDILITWESPVPLMHKFPAMKMPMLVGGSQRFIELMAGLGEDEQGDVRQLGMEAIDKELELIKNDTPPDKPAGYEIKLFSNPDCKLGIVFGFNLNSKGDGVDATCVWCAEEEMEALIIQVFGASVIPPAPGKEQ